MPRDQRLPGWEYLWRSSPSFITPPLAALVVRVSIEFVLAAVATGTDARFKLLSSAAFVLVGSYLFTVIFYT